MKYLFGQKLSAKKQSYTISSIIKNNISLRKYRNILK